MRSLSFSHSPFIEGRGRDCIKGTHSLRARIYLGKWSLARSEKRGRKALSNKLSHHSCIEHESLKRIDEIIFRLGFLRYILVQRFPLLLSFVSCRSAKRALRNFSLRWFAPCVQMTFYPSLSGTIRKKIRCAMPQMEQRESTWFYCYCRVE